MQWDSVQRGKQDIWLEFNTRLYVGSRVTLGPDINIKSHLVSPASKLYWVTRAIQKSSVSIIYLVWELVLSNIDVLLMYLSSHLFSAWNTFTFIQQAVEMFKLWIKINEVILCQVVAQSNIRTAFLWHWKTH